jgi:hypothetical protein
MSAGASGPRTRRHQTCNEFGADAKVITQPNGKAPGACNTEGFDADTTNDLNFATGARRSKAEATQIAEFALAGLAVHKGPCGGYLVCENGLSRYCEDFDDLRDFARRLEVSK